MGGVYDGSFSDSITEGDGIFAYLCSQAGINCVSSNDPHKIKETLQKQE